MTTVKAYRLILDQYRDALAEHEAAVDVLLELSEEPGQADAPLPLIVNDADEELLAAIRRETEAGAAVTAARRQLGAYRLTNS
jgi:hypothetical protein